MARKVNKLKSRIPYLGNNQALKNHIANALRNAGDLSVVIRNIDAIPKENMDSLTKIGLEKFKTEIIPEIRQIIKETQGETVQQGSKLEQAGAKQEVVKGEGWTMRDGGAAKTDYVIKTDLAPNVRDLSKITTDEITADLEYLAAKHPEIFDKPSDVFKLIKEIKENPTHFFTNNRLDYALIVKRLEDNKIGKLAVDKQSGEVKHATKVNSKDLKRLAKVSKEKSENAGIIQTFIQPGSKSQGELGLPTKRIIPQNSADRLVEKIIELDDAGKIGDMLRKTIISKDISTKTKLAAINAAKRRLVAITAKNTQKDDKKQK
nr:hypothetical protein [uncultured Campylobacter sp.]